VLANCKVPEETVIGPVLKFVLLMVRLDVELFCVIPVTFDPMPPLIKTLPLPLPRLVIVPVLLMDAVAKVMPSAVELSFLRVRLPVPVTPEAV